MPYHKHVKFRFTRPGLALLTHASRLCRVRVRDVFQQALEDSVHANYIGALLWGAENKSGGLVSDKRLGIAIRAIETGLPGDDERFARALRSAGRGADQLVAWLGLVEQVLITTGFQEQALREADGIISEISHRHIADDYPLARSLVFIKLLQVISSATILRIAKRHIGISQARLISHEVFNRAAGESFRLVLAWAPAIFDLAGIDTLTPATFDELAEIYTLAFHCTGLPEHKVASSFNQAAHRFMDSFNQLSGDERQQLSKLFVAAKSTGDSVRHEQLLVPLSVKSEKELSALMRWGASKGAWKAIRQSVEIDAVDRLLLKGVIENTIRRSEGGERIMTPQILFSESASIFERQFMWMETTGRKHAPDHLIRILKDGGLT